VFGGSGIDAATMFELLLYSLQFWVMAWSLMTLCPLLVAGAGLNGLCNLKSIKNFKGFTIEKSGLQQSGFGAHR